MTLAALIDALSKARGDVPVYYDFCRAFPTKVDSWRGAYSELALSFETHGYNQDGEERQPLTARALLGELTSAIGETYEGYKGGSYVMDPGTAVWVDNWGECTLTSISGVRDEGSSVVIETRYAP
jgi:hypothetical protein